MKDYFEEVQEQLDIMPKFSYGEKVMTKYGVGIIVNIGMPFNGLYVQPVNTKITVWYSARSMDNRFISMSFRPNEISKIDET